MKSSVLWYFPKELRRTKAVASSSPQEKSCGILDDTLGFEQNPVTQH